MRFEPASSRHPSENPRQAVRLLRHLHLAQVLWGREVAVPIAALDDAARGGRVSMLRALLHLEREGAVVVQRFLRAVRLADPSVDAPRADAIARD